MCAVFAVGWVVANRKRERVERDFRLDLPDNVLGIIGDDDPRFNVTL